MTRDHTHVCSAAGIDATSFPLVRLPAQMLVGCAFAWCGALSHLLMIGQPFVLIASSANAPHRLLSRPVQASSDRLDSTSDMPPTPSAVAMPASAAVAQNEGRIIDLWLASRRDALSRLCRGLVVIEPDIRHRLGARDAWGHFRESGGLRVCVISQPGLADDLARVLLHRHDASPTPRENRRANGRCILGQSAAPSSAVRSPRSKSGA